MSPTSLSKGAAQHPDRASRMSQAAIHAYLAARAAHMSRPIQMGDNAPDALNPSPMDLRQKAWEALGTGTRSWTSSDGSEIHWSGAQATHLEDKHVYRPLLIAEFDDNEEAALAAWALGQRPTCYPIPDST